MRKSVLSSWKSNAKALRQERAWRVLRIKGRERTQVERLSFHEKKDFSTIVNENNQGTNKNRAL